MQPRASPGRLPRIGLEPSYLSKVERGKVPPPSEEKIVLLAAELREDPDVLLSLAGKVSSDLLEIILRRPRAVGGLVRSLKNVSERRISTMTRQSREGASSNARERRKEE